MSNLVKKTYGFFLFMIFPLLAMDLAMISQVNYGLSVSDVFMYVVMYASSLSILIALEHFRKRGMTTSTYHLGAVEMEYSSNAKSKLGFWAGFIFYNIIMITLVLVLAHNVNVKADYFNSGALASIVHTQNFLLVDTLAVFIFGSSIVSFFVDRLKKKRAVVITA